MKSKNKKLVAIAVVIIFSSIIWFALGIRDLADAPIVEVQMLDSTKESSKNFSEIKNKSNPNQASKSRQLNPKTEKNTYYEIVGQSEERLEMDESLALNRVRRGLSRLQRGTFVTEAKRMSNLGEAYKHLINNEVFMDSKFPIWSIDSEGYFTFSGYQNCNQKAAFLSVSAQPRGTSGKSAQEAYIPMYAIDII